MTPKLKLTLLALGVLAAVLILTQLGLGIAIIRATGEGGDARSLQRLVKTHQHSGYTAVAVSIVYILLSLNTIRAIPARTRN